MEFDAIWYKGKRVTGKKQVRRVHKKILSRSFRRDMKKNRRR